MSPLYLPRLNCDLVSIAAFVSGIPQKNRLQKVATKRIWSRFRGKRNDYASINWLIKQVSDWRLKKDEICEISRASVAQNRINLLCFVTFCVFIARRISSDWRSMHVWATCSGWCIIATFCIKYRKIYISNWADWATADFDTISQANIWENTGSAILTKSTRMRRDKVAER